MSKRDKNAGTPQPMRHADHRRPMTRREFLAQGFMAGSATVLGPTLFGMFADPRAAHAASQTGRFPPLYRLGYHRPAGAMPAS